MGNIWKTLFSEISKSCVLQTWLQWSFDHLLPWFPNMVYYVFASIRNPRWITPHDIGSINENFFIKPNNYLCWIQTLYEEAGERYRLMLASTLSLWDCCFLFLQIHVFGRYFVFHIVTKCKIYFSVFLLNWYALIYDSYSISLYTYIHIHTYIIYNKSEWMTPLLVSLFMYFFFFFFDADNSSTISILWVKLITGIYLYLLCLLCSWFAYLFLLII